jgi:hypothetical protein
MAGDKHLLWIRRSVVQLPQLYHLHFSSLAANYAAHVRPPPSGHPPRRFAAGFGMSSDQCGIPGNFGSEPPAPVLSGIRDGFVGSEL